jgi:hypothetical protein
MVCGLKFLVAAAPKVFLVYGFWFIVVSESNLICKNRTPQLLRVIHLMNHKPQTTAKHYKPARIIHFFKKK